jgi:5-methyltetrahydrofolate--homocysteine methyltransferase
MDGAIGSLLMGKGLPPGTPPDSWNISKSDVVLEIQKQYYNAGSDIVLTNTFGGSRLKLKAHNLGDKVKEINQKGVEILKTICPENGFIAGDIGPSGKFLPPLGKVAIDDFFENFLEQAEILEKAGVDLFFVETMVDIKEAEAAVKAIKKISSKPIFASITYQKTKRGYFTVMGNKVDDCVRILEEAGADVIGANCTIGSEEMVDLVPLMKSVTSKPILVKPNAGKPQLVDGKTIYPTTSEEFANDIKQMVTHGAQVVGGCCGSNPGFITSINQKLKE